MHQDKHHKRTDTAIFFHPALEKYSRVVAKAVRRLRDHQLAESGDNYED